MNASLSKLDQLITGFDAALRTLAARSTHNREPYPAQQHADLEMDTQQSKHAAGLMRVNHTGEVCAQALYQGQAAGANSDRVQRSMAQAADEEQDHLAWCQQRLNELNASPSLFNPLFYAGSFAIGAGAARVGDRWSLGFVAETERQVVRHLETHLEKLPNEDQRSRAIIEKMRDDELQHATRAVEEGAAELPAPVKAAMSATSRIMTTLSYRL